MAIQPFDRLTALSGVEGLNTIVIARCAERTVAIQPFDRFTALSRVEGLKFQMDCRAPAAAARNDKHADFGRPICVDQIRQSVAL